MASQGWNPDVDGAVWQDFVESSTQEMFCRNWLALLCTMVEGTTRAMVLLGAADQGPFSPEAVWPDHAQDMQPMVPAAEKALAERQGVLLDAEPAAGERRHHLAYPFIVEGRLHGCVVLELCDQPEAALQSVLRQVHWGSSWLELMFRRKDAQTGLSKVENAAAVLELTATALQPGSFSHVAMALVNELAVRLACDRVSIGRVKKHSVHLATISNTARFDRRTNFVRALEAAMEEALDQECAVTWPQAEEKSFTVNRLHEELCRTEVVAVCTVPLSGREAVFGALTLERTSGEPFDAATVELCTTIAQLVGPILEAHWQNESWFGTRVLETLTRQAQRLFGPSHLALKLIGSFILIGLVVGALWRVEYRVSAKTVVEGATQRVIPAPFDGFLSGASVRAGDVVKKGQDLCTLDDRDLTLERARWLSEGAQYQGRYREAMANFDRSAASIAQAQIHQAEAEVALLDEKLARVKIASPFDGVVVSGDLSQRLGSPVRQGEELFKLAPLENYRIILQVDEREITYIAVGQPGSLILSSLPQETFPFLVKTVTPVSIAEGGRNYFRVEAMLRKGAERLRPGMEGIGKVESGERPLIWIWTHSLIDWLRLWIWSWWL